LEKRESRAKTPSGKLEACDDALDVVAGKLGSDVRVCSE
jgi:hypothetical protein